MSSKLTISVNETVVSEAKKYASSQGRSLSSLIEEYLNSLVTREKEEADFEVSPIVKSLWGSVKTIPKESDYKEIIGDEILKKYLK